MSINTNSRQGSVKVYQMKNKTNQFEMDSLTRDYAANKNVFLWAAITSLKAWDTCPEGEWKAKWYSKFTDAKNKAYSSPKQPVLPVGNVVEVHNIGCRILHRLDAMKECIENKYWKPVRYNMGQIAKQYALFQSQNLAYSKESIQEWLDTELRMLDTLNDNDIEAHVLSMSQAYQRVFNPIADKCQCHEEHIDADMVQAFAEVGLTISNDDNMNDRTVKIPVSRQHYEGGY